MGRGGGGGQVVSMLAFTRIIQVQILLVYYFYCAIIARKGLNIMKKMGRGSQLKSMGSLKSGSILGSLIMSVACL